ncbi:MAG: bifunctional demethylmenaquinone methyltransferase/2-methoxy-6-polyprenyl-1,4-benzoquinol methylase UbiE [Acidobacteria bacterium]|nr:MAG: bifunctional demethylmenaquinone methyltransferase/2-methoxy-6-polyprenyl-1,4-benzoquinol methylase UbiE [Acidobacteriota bacterium]
MKSLTVEGASVGTRADEQATASTVRSMFAAVAPRYDLLNHLLSVGFDIRWRRATVRALKPVLAKSSSVVADLCCGTGDLALALRQGSSGTVIGTDFCHPMLRRAREKSARRAKDTTFVEADTLRLPFRDASLDALTIAFGFRNLANYRRGVQEIRRVLHQGGMVAILEFSHVIWPVFGPLFRVYFRRILPRLGQWISGVEGPYQYLPDSVLRFPDQEALADLLRQEGFRSVRYRNFTGGVAALHLGEKA